MTTHVGFLESKVWGYTGETEGLVVGRSDGKFHHGMAFVAETAAGAKFETFMLWQDTTNNVCLNLFKEDDRWYVLTEEEIIYPQKDSSGQPIPERVVRIVRASLDNPDQPALKGAILGHGLPNSQRISGAPEVFRLAILPGNPNPEKYRGIPLYEYVQQAQLDGIGQIGFFKALTSSELSDDDALEILAQLRQ